MKKWCSKFSVISHEDWLIWCSWAKFFSPSFVIVVGKVQFCTNKGGISIRNPIDQERKGLMPSICIFYLFLPWFSCDSLLPPHFLLFLLILRGHSFNLNALCLRQMIDFHKVPTLFFSSPSHKHFFWSQSSKICCQGKWLISVWKIGCK